MATRHLLELGHRDRRAHPGPTGVAAGRRPPRRVPRGPRPGRASRRARSSPATGRRGPGYEGCLRILDEHPSTTALFVANDQMAMGALRALREAGRRVPEDVSVVGFDDIPEAAFSQPPLTTIRQDFAALGREAVRLVVGALGGEEQPSTPRADPAWWPATRPPGRRSVRAPLSRNSQVTNRLTDLAPTPM